MVATVEQPAFDKLKPVPLVGGDGAFRATIFVGRNRRWRNYGPGRHTVGPFSAPIINGLAGEHNLYLRERENPFTTRLIDGLESRTPRREARAENAFIVEAIEPSQEMPTDVPRSQRLEILLEKFITQQAELIDLLRTMTAKK